MIVTEKPTFIALAPMHNSKGKKDATAAFQPEARRFLEYHGQPESNLYLIDNHKTKANMRGQVADAISSHCGIRCIGFFCHGSKRGMQFGYDKRNVHLLAGDIAEYSRPEVDIPFYSCDVARDGDRERKDDLEAFGGDGGFCDELRDALCEIYEGFWGDVFGHTSVGHTSLNANFRVFPGMGSPIGGTGGFYIIHRLKKQHWQTWLKMIKTDFRYAVPLLSMREIHLDILEHE